MDRGVCVAVLKKVIRAGLAEKVTFEQRPGLGVCGVSWGDVDVYEYLVCTYMCLSVSGQVFQPKLFLYLISVLCDPSPK